MTGNKVLLSSVCKPIGPCVGDAESVGYELLHGQVTKAQHIYSPRVIHKQFALDYIAENLDTPSTVLHYPTRKAFIKELKKGYNLVGISFVLSTGHHILEMCRLVREYAPETKIVLGGYGTVMTDEELTPHCDYICREEGVAFMRRILKEPFLTLDDYRHPEISSRLRIFGIPVSHTAMVFAGLGCPNGCDFCCTSHFFKKKHVKLLPDGDAIFEVMASHQDKDSKMEFTILDEDFLLNRKRVKAFLARCREEQRIFSTFCFASVKALCHFNFDELLEMGIDGVWVGYEGKGADYKKHRGHDIDALICNLQDHGITVLTSMIVGIPYQSNEIARREFRELIATKPALTQILIYGPTPGTPFYKKVMEDDLLRTDLVNNRMKYYRECTGFNAMVKHPFLRREEIEGLQKDFYRRDFELLGPSIFRIADVKLKGWLKYRNHENPLLRKKAERFRHKLSKFLAILPVGILGPKISMRNRFKYLKMFFKILKIAPWQQKLYPLASPILMVGALITWFNITFNLMEHPLTRKLYYPGRSASTPGDLAILEPVNET